MSIEIDHLLAAEIARNVEAALAEDIGPGDLTASLVPGEHVSRATVISREAGVLCGRAWFEGSVKGLDPAAELVWRATDGERTSPDQPLCQIRANARALLSAVRTPLNSLQPLTAVASRATD